MEMKIGQINAVLYAAEEVLKRTKDKGTILLAKETAYDQIKLIMENKCPWSERSKEDGYTSDNRSDNIQRP